MIEAFTQQTALSDASCSNWAVAALVVAALVVATLVEEAGGKRVFVLFLGDDVHRTHNYDKKVIIRQQIYGPGRFRSLTLNPLKGVESSSSVARRRWHTGISLTSSASLIVYASPIRRVKACASITAIVCSKVLLLLRNRK